MNSILNKTATQLSAMFNDAGFKTCILKGQGNAVMYPDAFLRTPGDIDIWVQGKRGEIREFVQKNFSHSKDENLHIQFYTDDNVCVEVHYKPAFLFRKKYDNRLQEYFENHSTEQFENAIILPGTDGLVNVPTIEFNVIFQLAHMMKHFFQDGLGLRQDIDYYYLLKNSQECLTQSKKIENADFLKEIGVYRFTKGLMWLENYCFGLQEDCFIARPDEKLGKFLLKEMITGGNFGRNNQLLDVKNGGYAIRAIVSLYHALRLIPSFPKETYWLALWKTKLQFTKIFG